MYEERSFFFANGDGKDGLKQRPCWGRGATQEGTGEGVFLGRGNLLSSAAVVLLSGCWHFRSGGGC